MSEELLKWIDEQRENADSEYDSHYVGLVNEMLTKFEDKVKELSDDTDTHPYYR